ncbi:hypothetical protein AVEN_207761-1 [Araneus ventricosus]|uniref:Uncharacterized protein n=1 Tax=Araneus ventricosus TaxID=182803 RepID=A0A4Y2BYL3_ARAVE|nr:hypothetical protein AVEN_207761-1 [Araneus ventricosus]
MVFLLGAMWEGGAAENKADERDGADAKRVEKGGCSTDLNLFLSRSSSSCARAKTVRSILCSSSENWLMSTASIADPCPSERPPAPAHRSEGGTDHGRHARATGREGAAATARPCSTPTPRHVTGQGGEESAQLLAPPSSPRTPPQARAPPEKTGCFRFL